MAARASLAKSGDKVNKLERAADSSGRATTHMVVVVGCRSSVVGRAAVGGRRSEA